MNVSNFFPFYSFHNTVLLVVNYVVKIPLSQKLFLHKYIHIKIFFSKSALVEPDP